jgi:o-succinylbenzoate---CoA ligase
VIDLVALDLPLGPDLARQIAHAHDRGRAVFIVDQRLSATRQRDVLEAVSPTVVVDATGTASRRENGRPVEDGDGLVMLTSGSSGPPKGVVLTWTAIIASAELTSTELERGLPTCWNATLTPAHIGGFAVLARSIFTDDRLIFGPPDDLAGGPSLGATHVAVVRTHLSRFDPTGYHVVLLGGSRPPADIPGNVVTTWGMTETGSGVVYNRRALPGVHVACVDGEILVKSPTLLRAYVDHDVPWVVGPDGRRDWFATGDEGDVDDGIVRVIGRRGTVITTGGEKVWPEDLEAVLADVPAIRDVAVIGLPDDEWGERVIAIVVTTSPVAPLLEAARELARTHIGPWAAPKEICVVDELPRTETGKIRRDQLSALVNS